MFESIKEARKTLTDLQQPFEAERAKLGEEFFIILDRLQQWFVIADAAELRNQALTANEVTELSEQGLNLIDSLVFILVEKDLDIQRHAVQQLAVLIARWVIEQGGQLTIIQSVVDGLAYLANALRDKDQLLQLAELMSQVAFACSAVIKHDLDNSDPARPWRILNMNLGIVATRSHNLELMENVFADLIEAVPMDAPAFFKEGMSEMSRLNYPEAVRAVMQKFYQRTTLPARH